MFGEGHRFSMVGGLAMPEIALIGQNVEACDQDRGAH